MAPLPLLLFPGRDWTPSGKYSCQQFIPTSYGYQDKYVRTAAFCIEVAAIVHLIPRPDSSGMGSGNESNIFHSSEPLAGGVYPPHERKRGGTGQEEVWGWGCLSCECQVTNK